MIGRPPNEPNFPGLSPAQETAARQLMAGCEWIADDVFIKRHVEEPDTARWDEIGRFAQPGDAEAAAQAMQLLTPLYNEIVRLRRAFTLCKATAREFWAHEKICPVLRKRRKLPWA